MTSRSTRVLAVAGASVLAFSVAGLGHAGAGSEEGWTVDTEDCSDPDRANAPIEGTIRIGSAMPLSGGAAAAAFEPAARGLEAYINYANENDLVPGYELELTIGDDQYDPALTPGVVNGLIDDGVAPLRRDHRHAEQPRRARHAQRGVHPAAQRAGRRSAVRRGRRLPVDDRAADVVRVRVRRLRPDTSPRTSRTRRSGCSTSTTSSATSPSTTSAPPPTRPGWRSSPRRPSSSATRRRRRPRCRASPTRRPTCSSTVPLGAAVRLVPQRTGQCQGGQPVGSPVVYMTNTCAASALILGAAGENADGIYTSAAMGLVDVANPEVAAVEPVAVVHRRDGSAGPGRHHHHGRGRMERR